MKQFEYKTVYFKLPLTKAFDNKDAELNKLGQEGWELVGIAPHNSAASTSAISYYFKRQIEE